MSKLVEKIEEIKKSDLSRIQIIISDVSDNIIGKIAPVAIESCMNPGVFNIKPISIQLAKDMIVFENGRDVVEIAVKDLENGIARLQVSEFIPKTVKAKNHCTNCINCGRCSW